mmetsp:Transcript_128758/g.312922  ORF Transcript_128758/g.312922 Transcript_128758/m.312922 type:complete len:262 (+) Transcript_128758:51-836(+)
MWARKRPMAMIALSLISWSMSRADNLGSTALNSGSTYGRGSSPESTKAPVLSRGRNMAETRPMTRRASATVLYQSSPTQSTTRCTNVSASPWNADGSQQSSIMRRHSNTSRRSGPCFSRRETDANGTMRPTWASMAPPTTCDSCLSRSHTPVLVFMFLAPAARRALPADSMMVSSISSRQLASAEFWRIRAGGPPAPPAPALRSPTARDVAELPTTRGPESPVLASTAVEVTSVVKSVSRSNFTVSSRSLKRSTMIGAQVL